MRNGWTKVAFLIAALALLGASAGTLDARIPRYDHIFVIIDENKDFGQIIGNPAIPHLDDLARTYGVATNFYGIRHPSEPNYVAMLGGSTFGIADDDAYYCRPHDTRPSCENASTPDYASHTVDAPSLISQLEDSGLTWRAYAESIPAPGSDAVAARDPHAKDVPPGVFVYASKHVGMMNFASVQRDPMRKEKIVGFDALHADIAHNALPNFAYIIPNLCNDMHGVSPREDSPVDCQTRHFNDLIARGDRTIATLTNEIMQSATWKSSDRDAIVVTFDEDDGGNAKMGGLIATVVITNHGPRAVRDDTFYTHYSLLRTLEDAFGIHTYLQHANDAGTRPMVPLFTAGKP